MTVVSAIGSGAAGAPPERGKGERGTGLSPQTPLHSAALLQGKLLSSRRPNRSAAPNQNGCLAIPGESCAHRGPAALDDGAGPDTTTHDPLTTWAHQHRCTAAAKSLQSQQGEDCSRNYPKSPR